ncbi:MAG: hypothetical protein A2Z14_17180 [Chloroflexi bacterium RBG_16_48_8]|nr:MAG: hypothetical protein A2Z14_17180 [Chloroflexi bacterium RBG_16_48_8]
MRRLFIALVILLVMLSGCEDEAPQEIIPTQVTEDIQTPQAPNQTKNPASTATQTKLPEATATFQSPSATILEMTSSYLMAFHACDFFNFNCNDPRNHKVYLAGADDIKTWSLIPGWVPIQGSVPDVIRRGDTLYVYTGSWLVKYHFDSGVLDEPVQVQISRGEGTPSTEPVMPTDVSLILDDQDQMVMFFLFGKMGSDPAMCDPGEATCTKSIGSATEVEGSDGGAFMVNSGDRINSEIGEGKIFMSLSDPDIFTDGRDFYLLLSHGSWISVWTSSELHGSYQRLDVPPMGFLSAGSGGVASGYYSQEEGRYWIFSNIHLEEGMVIRLASPKDLTRQLEEGNWTTIIGGEAIGLGPGYNAESPGFTLNEP